MVVTGNMKSLSDINPYKTIFGKDDNDRDINIYKFDNVQSYGNGFYPNCLFKMNNSIINFSTEKVMSLKDSEIKFKDEINVSIDFIESNPLFYFVYNTDNYYHFIYDTLPYIISYFKIKESIPNIKLLMNYPNQSDKKMYRFVTEFLDLLNIKDEEILILNKKTSYKERKYSKYLEIVDWIKFRQRKYKRMTYHIDDTPLVQFPIRLSKDLHTRFTRVSQETRINKSTLLRIALDRLVTQIQNQGITAVLSETGVKG
jgi:hypothetical protein